MTIRATAPPTMPASWRDGTCGSAACTGSDAVVFRRPVSRACWLRPHPMLRSWTGISSMTSSFYHTCWTCSGASPSISWLAAAMWQAVRSAKA